MCSTSANIQHSSNWANGSALRQVSEEKLAAAADPSHLHANTRGETSREADSPDSTLVTSVLIARPLDKDATQSQGQVHLKATGVYLML